MRLTIVFVLLTSACGGNDNGAVTRLTTAPDELKALTYNMYYGLAVDILPENLHSSSLSASAQAIINATSLTDYGCRLQGTASQIVTEQPDVIGLQEALLIAYARKLDNPSKDSVLIDFIEQLVDDIVNAGGPRYQVFQRQNATIQDTLPLVGGIRIADRSAILVHPRLAAHEVGALTYATLEPASDIVPGTNGVVVRGALHVRVTFPSSAGIELFNTHLQSGDDTAVREAQSAELNAWIQANSDPGATIVLTGDLNDIPTSPAVMQLTQSLVDTYATVGVLPGFTAYQDQSLTVPVDEATLRIDYVLVRAAAVQESHVVFNAQVQPCGLWPSDHFGVVSQFRTGATPQRAQQSE